MATRVQEQVSIPYLPSILGELYIVIMIGFCVIPQNYGLEFPHSTTTRILGLLNPKPYTLNPKTPKP